MMDAIVPPDSEHGSAVATFDRIIHTLDGMVEMMLELNYARRAPGDFSPIARRLVVIECWQFVDMLDDAVDDGRLSEDERSAVLLADLVLSGSRRTDAVEVYLLAEIAESIGLDDVEHAVERAALLAKLGRQVIPVVAGRWINDEAAELAHRLGVWSALGGLAIVPRPA